MSDPTAEEVEALNKAIWWAVLQECQGQIDGEPHAVTWARGGYRNDVPTLCGRCERLIGTLQSLVVGYRKPQPITEAQVEAAWQIVALATGYFGKPVMRAALEAVREVTQ